MWCRGSDSCESPYCICLQLASAFTMANLDKMTNLVAVVACLVMGWALTTPWFGSTSRTGWLDAQSLSSCRPCTAATGSHDCAVKFARCFLAASHA